MLKANRLFLPMLTRCITNGFGLYLREDLPGMRTRENSRAMRQQYGCNSWVHKSATPLSSGLAFTEHIQERSNSTNLSVATDDFLVRSSALMGGEFS